MSGIKNKKRIIISILLILVISLILFFVYFKKLNNKNEFLISEATDSNGYKISMVQMQNGIPIVVNTVPTTGSWEFSYECDDPSAEIDWNMDQTQLLVRTSRTALECLVQFSQSQDTINIISLYLNGEYISELDQNGLYNLQSYTCVNSETVTWAPLTKTLSITPLTQRTRCSLYFTDAEVAFGINPTSGTIYVGSPKTSTVVGQSYGALSCTSSDVTKATCSLQGNILTITGAATGTATITVTEANKGSIAQYNATIKETTFALSENSSISYENGPRRTATISGTDYGRVTCSSSNSNVATCIITGNQLTVIPGGTNGIAIITVREANGDKTLTYTITVRQTLRSYIINNYESLGVERVTHPIITGYEYRWLGANPENYLIYNGERWRIIGVLQTKEDINSPEVLKVKITPWYSIGNYQWYNSGAEGTYYSWADSTLQTYLNGTYYNGLTEEAKSMIEPTMWYVNRVATSGILGVNVYTAERSKTTWTGIVGVPYVSDYAYADGNTCATGTAVTTVCGGTSWMETNGNWKWAINPNTQSYSTSYPYQYTSWSTYAINPPVGESYGNMHKSVAYKTLATFPTVYLKADVLLLGGTGKVGDAYRIEILD